MNKKKQEFRDIILLGFILSLAIGFSIIRDNTIDIDCNNEPIIVLDNSSDSLNNPFSITGGERTYKDSVIDVNINIMDRYGYCIVRNDTIDYLIYKYNDSVQTAIYQLLPYYTINTFHKLGTSKQ